MDSDVQEQSCEIHGRPTELFCMGCDSILCPSCVESHRGHRFTSTEAACQEKMELVEEQHRRMEELTRQLQSVRERADELRGLNETKTKEKTGCIDNAYKNAERSLKNWREVELEKATQPNTDRSRAINECSAKLRHHVEEGKGLSTAFSQLSKSIPAIILKGLEHIQSKMDTQISTTENDIDQCTATFIRIQSELERDVAYPRELKVEEVFSESADRNQDSGERQGDKESGSTSPKESIEEKETKSSDSGRRVLCDPHGGEIVQFCGTCAVALCLECFNDDHNSHTIKRIDEAFRETKKSLEDQLEKWAKAKESLQAAWERLLCLGEEAKKKFGGQIDDINNQYRRQHEELESRRKDKTDSVNQQRKSCEAEVENFALTAKATLEEMENLDQQYTRVLSGAETWLLKESEELARRIDQQLSSANKETQHVEGQLKQMQEILGAEFTFSLADLTHSSCDGISQHSALKPF